MLRLKQFLPSIIEGVKWGVPIVLGAVPVGMAYGLLAQQIGLGMVPAAGMSVLVFAGASQLMAVSMLQQGIGAAAIIGTTFIVNFRHVLMSASLAPHLGKYACKSSEPWKTWQRMLLGATLTDESFAILSLRFTQSGESPATNPTSAITLHFTMYTAWVVSSLVGHSMGALIEHPEKWGLDFALPAMFIGLLVPACATRKPAAVAALVGGTVAVALHILGAGSMGNVPVHKADRFVALHIKINPGK